MPGSLNRHEKNWKKEAKKGEASVTLPNPWTELCESELYCPGHACTRSSFPFFAFVLFSFQPPPDPPAQSDIPLLQQGLVVTYDKKRGRFLTRFVGYCLLSLCSVSSSSVHALPYCTWT